MPFPVLLALAVLATAPPVADPHAGQYTRGLGVACAHCHEDADWTRSAKPPFAAAIRMARMTATFNEGPFASRGRITCFTCHRGSIAPSAIPESAWRPVFNDWPATATVRARDGDRPAREVYRNLQVLGSLRAADIRVAMSLIAASLDVNCEYCHAGDEWDSDNKPAKATARDMLRMVSSYPQYFPGGGVLAVHCYTCHAGAPDPAREP